jgi:hypothetical protein
MRAAVLAFATFLLPVAALAAGSDDEAPPAPTETSTKCEDGQIWDDEARRCVAAEDARFDDEERYRAVRELAWAGRPEGALAVLAAMQEGESDRVLAYRGFALRSSGRVEEGMAVYEAAIARNPGNILARSYYGQLLVTMNETALAQDQLAGLRAAGGAGTWAEAALMRALATGTGTSY